MALKTKVKDNEVTTHATVVGWVFSVLLPIALYFSILHLIPTGVGRPLGTDYGYAGHLTKGH
ncbi:MAG: hypothetical protein C4575_05325 [Desulforudis sp.]|jgi:hypothetical protein|nr:MAG: hypothetical protein C4575_05325 [Desulforudis sp.]